MALRVAVLGATGAVGREMLRTLEARSFPVGELVPYATARSTGTRLPFMGSEVRVRDVGDASWDGVDVALFSAGAGASREHAPRAAGAGAVVIDNSSAFRMDPAIPLVVPEINAAALNGYRGIVANPNCTTIVAAMAVAPLHRAAGLLSLVVSSYQSVSGAGYRGVRELLEQVEKLRGQEEELLRPDPASLPSGEVFGRTIAYNVLARCGDVGEGGFTSEEVKLVNESRKILGIPDLAVSATVVRVPVMAGHSVSLHATFARELDPEEARSVLAAAPGIELVDQPEADRYPTPIDSAGRDEVLVGRVRRPAGQGRSLLLFAAGDNLRKGAALNAVQIAEHVFGVRPARRGS